MANEKRLIDANALRKRIDHCDIDTFTDKQTICEQIADAPTVDAVEVVHGRWKNTSYVGVSRCSHCDKPSSTPDCLNVYFDYCPNCGAKMDLER